MQLSSTSPAFVSCDRKYQMQVLSVVGSNPSEVEIFCQKTNLNLWGINYFIQKGFEFPLASYRGTHKKLWILSLGDGQIIHNDIFIVALIG